MLKDAAISWIVERYWQPVFQTMYRERGVFATLLAINIVDMTTKTAATGLAVKMMVRLLFDWA